MTQNNGAAVLFALASPGGGTYNSAKSVQLAASPTNAKIYYSFNSAPTLSSQIYSGPISISTDTALKFMAVDSSGRQSQVYSESYIIDTVPPAAPTITSSANKKTVVNPYPTFYWETAVDANYYILQYSNNVDFSSYTAIPYLRTTNYTLSSPLSSCGDWHWRIKAVDNAGNESGWSTVQFAYTADTTVHKALIVGGNSSELGNVIEMITSEAYKALRYQNYAKTNIKLLLPNTTLDLDGDAASDVSGAPTKADMQSAVADWAKDADDLILFMIGESNGGDFKLNTNETLTGSELNAWLYTLQSNLSTKVYMVYDAPNSGDFIPKLIPPPNKNRIIITSSSGNQSAGFLKNGTLSFSYQFWLQVISSAKLYESFLIGKNMMSDYQTSMIEANGNGIGNEKEDKTLFQRSGFILTHTRLRVAQTTSCFVGSLLSSCLIMPQFFWAHYTSHPALHFVSNLLFFRSSWLREL